MTRTLYRTRIKFCGMTRPGDVRLAGELGVDAVGFVFAEGSPRQVTAMQARQLRLALAPMVGAVALFRDNSAAEVREVVRQVRPSLLQFHGNEDDAFCRAFRLPWMKAVPMGGGEAWDARALQQHWPNAAAFLFDSHGTGGAGGTGHAFDWSRIPTGLHRPFVLAGGITADNVHDAIQATLPWAVDVASGIEVSPGIKDGEKMRRFVAEVRRADCAEMD
ncbi:phosphoribosylanthranilate isomerase [Pseudoxanthomonas broegbernensis]|uniref:N-(5'-phosphoribosyl)anthranilate isomerase n=1 Tax=Pseudoxanthomonas broegbernensis TaxID=83619 RepID=A0A7V8K7Y2_9GAMM|nr:phosphoribosylanthranilate isomerase [Pseudoxanthomonas broegbernensis]KAF1687678.1 phosphoribosylanthranilate isomerase [Pseudoxanthomonas broegbernensis]MBB6064705.1 phosphoribosylanthranilate isomerase [Pseudoxanthomonas broegbernensis]